MPISHKVQLMTYPDSLGGNLKTLKETLDTYLSQAIGFVHILPFYPSSGDRGFAPLTHMEVEPAFGTWEDIKAIAHTYDVQSDLVVGHMSVYSPEFQDYLKHGLNSKYADMFASLDKTFPNGTITLDELTKFDELTPIPPVIIFELGDGTKRAHFKTFLPMQADLDPMSELTWEYYDRFVKHLSEQGIKMIRLDAVGTIYKHPELGMNMVPETYEILQKLIDLIHSYDMEVLTEIHSDLETKKRIVDMGAWTYDFHLPARIFQAILTRDVTGLEEWYQICPKNQIAVLTNHDGINVTSEPEYVGSEEAAQALADLIIQNAGYSTKAASGLTSQNVSVHSINATLLEACFRDQNQWLMAHVLQLFAPGIPQVYYNDLLAQRNDEERWHETGEGRELVRHNHPASQIDHKFNQPFVQKVIRIMEFRSNYPAFQGSVEVLASDPTEFHVVWTNAEYKAVLHADMDSWMIKITYYNPEIKEFQTLDLE